MTCLLLSFHLELGSVYFASWGKSTAGAILPLANRIIWSGHTTNLEYINYLVECDVCYGNKYYKYTRTSPKINAGLEHRKSQILLY